MTRIKESNVDIDIHLMRGIIKFSFMFPLNLC